MQVIIALAAIAAVFTAGLAALRASDAIEVAKKGIQSQADENRLSTAVDAIGGDSSTQRVAGLTFLRRLATQKLDIANEDGASESERRDAMRLYRATIDILANYMKTPSAPPSATFGVGVPPLPPDYAYAASDLYQWLGNGSTFRHVARGDRTEVPNIGLEHAWLFGVYWPRIDLHWLSSRYFAGVDLRKATLDHSNWGKSTLTNAHLGCASLSWAKLKGSDFTDADSHSAILTNSDLRGTTLVRTNLKGADLRDANLRDANLTDADLRGTNLNGANLRGANFTGAIVTGATYDGAVLDSGALDDARQEAQPTTDAAAELDPACPGA